MEAKLRSANWLSATDRTVAPVDGVSDAADGAQIVKTPLNTATAAN
tara:strand:+ start:4356 stop:4493 length:138 start_codon:yes stop_codon:yes gene_type:complete